MNHRSRFPSTVALRKCLKISSSFVLRAVAHGAKSVRSGAAHGAPQPIPANAAFMKALEVIVGHGQRPCWSAVNPRSSAPEAGSSAETATFPYGGSCGRSNMRLQSKHRFGLSPRKSAKVPANHSLNRTLHGMPGFGPPFHSGPNPAMPFRAG